MNQRLISWIIYDKKVMKNGKVSTARWSSRKPTGNKNNHTRKMILTRNWRKIIFWRKLKMRMTEKETEEWKGLKLSRNFKMLSQKPIRNWHQRQWKEISWRNLKKIFSEDHWRLEWQENLEEQLTTRPRLSSSIAKLSGKHHSKMNGKMQKDKIR